MFVCTDNPESHFLYSQSQSAPAKNVKRHQWNKFNSSLPFLGESARQAAVSWTCFSLAPHLQWTWLSDELSADANSIQIRMKQNSIIFQHHFQLEPAWQQITKYFSSEWTDLAALSHIMCPVPWPHHCRKPSKCATVKVQGNYPMAVTEGKISPNRS